MTRGYEPEPSGLEKTGGSVYDRIEHEKRGIKMKTLLRACVGLLLILMMCGPASAGAATYRSPDGSLFTFYGDYTMSVDADWGRFNGVWWWDRYPSDVAASYDGGRVQLVISLEGNLAWASANGGRSTQWVCISERGVSESEDDGHGWFMKTPLPGQTD